MAEPILDKASYSLVRTNPKLTGNVKLVTNGKDLYLDSFSANVPLSSSKFKAFKIDGTSTYDQDVFKFFKNGSLPPELAYEVFQEFRDTSVLSSYGNQYEMFYSAGASAISSEVYTEDLGILAPIWLNEQIPNYFVVFRIDNPASINNINSILESDGETLAQSSVEFSKFVLENCTAIKTFDLTETSVIGSYIRRYRSKEDFPKSPITVSWRKDEPILWNGISYKKGGFTSVGNFSYNDLIVQDSTIIQNEYFFTKGFERNGVLVANLINLEFLFSDLQSSEYSFNRYFGLYVNEINEGSFQLSGEGFYQNLEDSQLPKIKTINQISQFLDKPFVIKNKNGVLIHFNNESVETVTGVPTPTRVNETKGIFYIRDKNNEFHTIKKGSLWKQNEIRLFDKSLDVSLLAGYNNINTFTSAKILKRQGKATAFLSVLREIPDGLRINFYDGNEETGFIIANKSLTDGPGTFFEYYFNPTGKLEEIANAIRLAIENGIREEDRFFNPTVHNFTVYLQSRFGGSRFNRLSFEINLDEYPDEVDPFINTYPSITLSNMKSNFVGGNDVNNGLLLVSAGDQSRFTRDRYVKTKDGYTEILDWVPYLDEPIINEVGTQLGYKGIDDKVIITLNRDQIDINKSDQVALYTIFKPSFGRFSFFPVKDFDFDFYSEDYSNLKELKHEISNYNTLENIPITIANYSVTYEGYPDPVVGTYFATFNNQQLDLVNQIKFDTTDADNDDLTLFLSGLNAGPNSIIRINTTGGATVLYRITSVGPSVAPGEDYYLIGVTHVSGIANVIVDEIWLFDFYTVGVERPYEAPGSWPDIRGFYNSGGFSNLIGLLKDVDPNINYDLNISSEYQRLEENYLKEYAVASRIIPYINKWGWYNQGKDVRNNPYRLNVNLAFGINNFSPSKWDSFRSTSGFTHEWYYLSKFPHYFNTEDHIADSISYFSHSPNEDTFKNVNVNLFDKYFICDRFAINGSINLIDRQLRYGRFGGGDKQNYAETFLRGVRVIAKSKTAWNEFPNFNAKKLSYIKDGLFNDYRFSALVIVNEPNKPKSQIKFIKNERWKTIVMLIYVSLINDCVNPEEKSIDRTLLYSLNSSPITDENCNIIYNEDGSISYKDTIMQGAIDFRNSSYNNSTESYVIRGMTDINGITTSFFDDIKVGSDGRYPAIEFIIDGDSYKIEEISKIISPSELIASKVTQNSNPYLLPRSNPGASSLKSAEYMIKGGGYNEYLSTLSNIGFSAIYNAVNEGDPKVIYETVDNNGNSITNTDGTLAQTFSIELRAQDDILKSAYIGTLSDSNKPTVFNLVDIIGYDLSLQRNPKIIPIARHSGWYEPISRDLLYFKDPYAEFDFYNELSPTFNEETGFIDVTDNLVSIEDGEYKFNVFNLCRHKNSEFNSNNPNFGIIKNFFYHKVNEEDSSTILELSSENAFTSIYPKVNEIGIDRRDYYIFSSNWEPGYFIKSIDKSKIQKVIGTKSMKEKKTFFGSKYLKVPQQITLEKFIPSEFFKDAIKEPKLIPGTFMYDEYSTYTEFYLFIQKALVSYLAERIKPVFEKYIKSEFGIGDVLTLDDDVNTYIEQNVLNLYKVKDINFYVSYDRSEIPNNYNTALLSNSDKTNAGLNINNNVSSKVLNNNPFDLKLIYNKRLGFSESYGFSITIIKK